MKTSSKKLVVGLMQYARHDFKASITVFFVALPLCLGVALASGAPVYSGILAGVIGGVVVSILSGSALSVSGPAAGLTAICAAAITDLGAIEIFFLSVSIGGILQILMGVLRLGGFTHFIPSAVIKGMLAAIGIILISKQIPLLLGYDEPDFWTDEMFNILTFHSGMETRHEFWSKISPGAMLLSAVSFGSIFLWNRYLAKRIPLLPVSFVVVIIGSAMAYALEHGMPSLQLRNNLFVALPKNVLAEIKLPDLNHALQHAGIWKYGIIIGFVATLETLLGLEAIDKLDPYKRVSPSNRELIAQGSGNFLSGLLGGIPITAVIVRSSANALAGAKSKLSAFTHGIWLLLVVIFAVPLVQLIPYCVLAIILINTGYSLTKPSMFKAIYKQGREQFIPFLVTIIAILFTDLLIGVLIGVVYAIYFLIKHTYRAGYTLTTARHGHIDHYTISLALNVSFLNKKKFLEMLNQIPAYSVVEIIGTHSVYIDHDVMEIFHNFKSLAHLKHIELTLKDIPDVEITSAH